MKKIILLFLLLVSSISFAQQTENISIEWVDNSGLFSEDTSIKIPVFNSPSFSYDYISKAIFFKLKIPVAGFADENSLKITNIIYETIPQSKLGALSVNSIPNSIQATFRNMNNPESQKAVISLSPIIKSAGGFQRIKSFSYTYSLGTNQKQRNNFSVNAVSNSVLNTGEWFRFYVEKSGVYKISRSFLESLGMNASGSDPRNLKIYGNGGRMIPLLNSTSYPIDLAENAITVIGENDGSFDRDDYILFYAEGVDNWNQDSQTHNNIFSDRSYYYVTAQGGTGKRIGTLPTITANSTLNLTSFDDYQYYEIDKNNIGRLGKRWFGEAFNIKDEQTFEFKFPNIVAASQMQIEVVAAANAFATTKMDVAINEQALGSFNFNPINTDGPLANLAAYSGSFTVAENIKVKLTYSNNGIPSANAYLDYIILKAKRGLTGHGKQFRFQYNDASTTTGVVQYQFSNATGISAVWDVTDIYNVSKIENAGTAQFSFKAYLGEIRKYVAIDPSNYLSPAKESQSRVVNQNLKGTIFKNNQGAFQDVDYIIVTPASLNSQAERLATFHRNYSQLNVKVVNLENIYQEFSSGKQDLGAIRNFVKYVYENASIPSKRLKYLNLFGDASFDYKNRIPNNTNIVPAFQSLESFSLEASYVTDDFFAMFDDNEGEMNPNNSAIDDMEIAVGRMLVSSNTQAAEMVNKVIEYHSIESYGKWRNNFVLISDDVDREGEDVLQKGLDQLGQEISAAKPFINVKKIHMDSYVQESSAGGYRYPKARQDFVDAFEQGGLVFNYYGHGGEDGLAHERVFERTDAQNLNNRYKYPLFITITCEFTRFDNPYRPTGGEDMYWNPKGGAISLVTTTRKIGILSGELINRAFSSELFGFGTNEYVSVADALRISKNNYGGSALMVSYIGDPAIKLAIPKPTIVLTKINDEPAATSPFVFNALRPVKLTGEVRNLDGNSIISNYNGDLSINIFDKNVQKKTLGNDGVSNGSGLIIMDFELLGETIFRGNASVKNGQFELSFVVPRDITIPVGNGRISFYAKRTQGLEDQTGYNTDIKVGGINESAVADNIGPRAKLYMNDETFISGGITNESPFFLAFLEDENGINTASGIGHDIVAVLDGDENNPYILNDYYETELDDYTKGKVRFPLRNLAVGLHTITFKAWDVYNNPITAEIQFIVVGDENVTLTHVLNYPNPFVSYTQFWFTHNRPYEPLEVQVQVLTITGKIVKTINQIVNTEGFLSREITWDGKDDFGDKIGKGVYVYKLTVKSTFTNKKTEKFEKLVIL